jgi:hypothetical protein
MDVCAPVISTIGAGREGAATAIAAVHDDNITLTNHAEFSRAALVFFRRPRR